MDDPALVGEIATELWHAFEDDVINGDAQSRGEWTGYALGLVGTAVVGDKGVSKIANSGQLAKLGRIGGKDGYKTRHEIELRLATQTPPTRPNLNTFMNETKVSGVKAISTYAQSMKIGAVMTAGQASNAIKRTTTNMKDSLGRGMNNLQENLNGAPAVATAGAGGSKLPVNVIDIHKIRADVNDIKKQSVREVETRARGGSKGTGNGYKYWNKTTEFNNVRVYKRDDIIDLSIVDGRGRTNLDRMKKRIGSTWSGWKVN